MDAILLTDLGVEEYAALEVKERLNAKGTVTETAVKFPVKDYLELCKFTYLSQSARKTMLLLGEIKFKELDDLLDKAETIIDIDWKDWFKDTKFKISCTRLGEHSFVSRDVEEELGASMNAILKKQKIKPTVSLVNPDLIIHCHIAKNKAYLGIDFSGRELSKRDYKVYLHSAAIRGNVAYALVRMAGFEKGVLVDPFAGEGTIPIEAAFHLSGKSINMHEKNLAFQKLIPLQKTDWDKFFSDIDKKAKTASGCHGFGLTMRHVRHAKANAKIAGVEADFGKCEVDALDLKFSENEVDCIVTHPPQITHRNKEPAKLYDELFYHAKYILKKDGCVVALLISPKEFLESAEKHGFSLLDKKVVRTGSLETEMILLKNTRSKPASSPS